MTKPRDHMCSSAIFSVLGFQLVFIISQRLACLNYVRTYYDDMITIYYDLKDFLSKLLLTATTRVWL